MDIAILIHAKREGGPARNQLMRPFADSSLIEIALEKLSTVDAPCKKYVAVADKEMKQVVAQFHGLNVVRRDTSEAEGATEHRGEYGYLSKLPEEWFLVVNPLYPLVAGESWWEAIESFLADEPHAWTSAEKIDGPFWNATDDGAPGAVESKALIHGNGAFRIVKKSSINAKTLTETPAAASPFVLPATACWGIHEMEDVTAVEAVYSMSQLGIFA